MPFTHVKFCIEAKDKRLSDRCCLPMSLASCQILVIDVGTSQSAWVVQRFMVKCLENQSDAIYYPAFFMVGQHLVAMTADFIAVMGLVGLQVDFVCFDEYMLNDNQLNRRKAHEH
ncbi:hypothetical protein MAM1_0151c06664 [Mucor ambiguus]|uniref:Uncharacterized protein n=1 Tax=Mucor ambiguus TaxID=91626 RepID=A0A0C9M9P2_9FUNG|nr:hypothetical protein MAM1_0151c06664 [Mucor ambiguus]